MRARRARREDAAGSGRDGDRGGRDDAATADAAAAREDDDDDVGLFREWRRAMTAPREDQEAFGRARAITRVRPRLSPSIHSSIASVSPPRRRWRAHPTARRMEDVHGALVLIFILFAFVMDLWRHPFTRVTLRLQQNFLTCFVVNVVALSLPLLRARAGIAPATRPALVRATYVVFACTMTGLIAHVGTTITRPVPIKYRYCFNAYVALFTQLAWDTPRLPRNASASMSMPRIVATIPTFMARVGIYIRWNGRGPYRCNLLGVCSGTPGPNHLGFPTTWLGCLSDVSVTAFVMTLAEAKLALSWRLWRRQVRRQEDAASASASECHRGGGGGARGAN
ncbi:uncharacterized protein MICPUCDRAFT_64114 [Micromonas pusilla CCMP1545]|uniref:Predicted protein n=1 Tax=Micromonas pusilla (strain CCMP1545) TaxID=564608 RepID=C1MJX2_MICPC|nr:uncharacterized protein MICPUCDRAFT_64114 [Micromonas pusilla CCMP1545]EEH59271.1 predicted protein [Micromonas pusilla CCMP1545]|eukprot:XP_003055895.1 predicted protein [Micromonas pusilla CCMP1545]